MTSARFLFALKLITLIFFFFAFAYKTVTFVDPDLGWHLRAGEIVAQTGHAPMIDPWNYVVTEQEWIDHEWLLDLFLWDAWTEGYWPVVILLFFIASFIPIVIWIFRARSSVQLLFVVLATSIIWTIIGARPQTLSFLLFFFFYEFLFSLKDSRAKRVIYLLIPLIFMLWANIHAGFVAGLVLWILVFLTRAYERIRISGWNYRYFLSYESVSMIASVGATLLSPYHFSLWTEIVASTVSPLIAYVSEWQSPLSQFNIPLIIFLGSGAALILVARKTLPLQQLIPMIFFFVSYMEHARMAPFFLITTLPLIEKTLAHLDRNTKIVLEEFPPICKKILLFTPAVLLLALLSYNSTSVLLREPYQPPYEAINALKSIPYESCNIFNDYGFGGWMIFVDPMRKVFIDGRSPHWRSADDVSPFEEYINVIKHPQTFEQVFTKYNICVAFLANTGRTQNVEHEERAPSAWLNIFTKIIHFFYPEPTHTPLSITLRDAGWCGVYGDSKAVILIKPGSPLCMPK